MFLRRDFFKGQPVREVADHRNLNRIANILETLEVIGGRMVRSYSNEGTDWKLIIDGSNVSNLPADVQATFGDRLFAVDSLSVGRRGNLNFTGADSVGYQAATCIHVSHDVCSDPAFSGVAYHRLRFYLKTAGIDPSPVYILGLNSSGQVVLTEVQHECPANT